MLRAICLTTFACALALAGCGRPMPSAPLPPEFPIMSLGVDYWTPAKSSFRYEPAEGTTNPQVLHGLSVGIIPLAQGGIADVPDLTTTCEISAGRQITFLPSGMAVLLTIENNTGHIIRLANSAILFEDDRGNEYPLVGDNMNFMLAQQIDAVFDPSRAWLDAEYERVYLEAMGHIDRAIEAYVPKWHQYVADVKKCNPPFVYWGGSRPSCEDPDPRLTPEAVRAELIHEFDPRMAEQHGQRNEFGSAKTACLEQVSEKLSTMRGAVKLITNENYEKIRILPDKTLKAFIPMMTGKNFTGAPATANFKLYDLVTRTDTAGNPTQRSHFNFVLVRKDE